MEDAKTGEGHEKLNELQTELMSAHHEIRQQMARVTALGCTRGPGPLLDEHLLRLEPRLPEEVVADELGNIDDGLTLEEYLDHLRRLAEMSPDQLQAQWRKHQFRHLHEVARTFSRDVGNFGEMLNNACSGSNFPGLAALFRGVHRASKNYVFVADRLEAFTEEQVGLPARA